MEKILTPKWVFEAVFLQSYRRCLLPSFQRPSLFSAS